MMPDSTTVRAPPDHCLRKRKQPHLTGAPISHSHVRNLFPIAYR
ncbi:hypothetical protein SMICM17S_07420 [Streptomyces microflavus]